MEINLKFDVDIDQKRGCKKCKKTIRKILGSDGILNPIPANERLLITPDYNAWENLTHYHLELINVKDLRTGMK